MTLIQKTAQEDSVYNFVKSHKQVPAELVTNYGFRPQITNITPLRISLQARLGISNVFGPAIYYGQRVTKTKTSRFWSIRLRVSEKFVSPILEFFFPLNNPNYHQLDADLSAVCWK